MALLRSQMMGVLAALLVAAVAALPTPSPAQLRYQSTDFVALIHFNMATFARDGDPGCNADNWNKKAANATGPTSDPATFNPKLLNTSQWMDSITALGANIAVLTAKHGCGFSLWPTKAKLPGGRPYNYCVGVPGAAVQYDVLRSFVDAAQRAGVGHGFYFSIMKNFYLCRSFSGNNSCQEQVLPGQHNLSDAEYIHVAEQQARELWTRYGNFTRLWTDSSLGGLGDLMDQLQPQAAGTPGNPVYWCGTEGGFPSKDVGPGEIWDTGDGFFGDSNSSLWVPKFCDPQLFRDHVWFWEPGRAVRNLTEMIPIYHDIVGRGFVMELAFSIDRDGLVEESHAKTYRQLGEWVRECYGTPVSSTSGRGSSLQLTVAPGACVDRVQIEEDIVLGQRVRNYTVEQRSSEGSWKVLARASAIGRKRIHLLPKALVATGEAFVLRLNVQSATAMPVIRHFGAYAPCRNGCAEQEAVPTSAKLHI